MLYRLSTGDFAGIGRWPSRGEQLETKEQMGRDTTVDEQLVIFSREEFLKAIYALGGMEMEAALAAAGRIVPPEAGKFPLTS